MKSWYFDQKKQTLEEEELKIGKRKFILGLSLIIFSFVLYFCLPLIFFLPLSLKVKASSVSISYLFSWGLTGIGIYFTGREGYESIKRVPKGFFKKIIGKNKNE